MKKISLSYVVMCAISSHNSTLYKHSLRLNKIANSRLMYVPTYMKEEKPLPHIKEHQVTIYIYITFVNVVCPYTYRCVP